MQTLRPRATHAVLGVSEQERPTDVDRLAALNKALLAINSISSDELLGDDLAGTAPSRIYRSFVAPKPTAEAIPDSDSAEYIQTRKPLLGPLERAAQRTAVQIEQAMRQVRADRASYLRNTDKPLASLLNAVAVTADMDGEIKKLNPVVIVLDNLRSAFNVGSIFRSADTAGAAGVITCGICPKVNFSSYFVYLST